ncbi:MAG: MFS transporter [Spirochaetales bacterium]|nr:MFS transporter [Spirochaetales bacterium]
MLGLHTSKTFRCGTPGRREVTEAERRTLRLLVSGNAVSTFGNAVYLVTVTLLLKDLTASALVLGLFQFLALSPGFLLSPISGAVIDRYPRVRTVVLSDLYRGLLMVASGLLLMIPGMRSPWLILPVSFLSGVGHAFFVPAAQALLPSIVASDRLQTANGVRAAAGQLSNMAGNAVGGLLYALLGAPILFVFNGISFLISASRERLIRSQEAPSERSPPPVFDAAREGLAMVVGSRAMRTLFLSQAGLFVVSPVLLLSVPFIVIDELGMAEGAVGLFFAAALAGGIVVFVALRRVPPARMAETPLPMLAYIALGTVFGVLALSTHPAVLIASALLVGAAAGLVYLFVVTWIQRMCPERHHGRLFALLEAGSSLAAPTSYVVAGALLELLGPGRRWWLFAATGFLAYAWSVRLALLRRSSA